MRNVLVGSLLAIALAAAGCADMAYRGPGDIWGREVVGGMYGVSFGRGRSTLGGDVFAEGGGGAALFSTAAAPVGSDPTAGPVDEPAAGPVAEVEPRKVVYSGRFDIVVPDVEKAVAATRKMAETMGGYMQQMTGKGIVVRVPAARFDEAVESLGKMGTITEREVTAQDVTEEYVDLALRLANARKLVEKLQELLGRAKTVKEALDVEKELARVRTEIELMEGQLNRLKSRIAYATLSVEFTPTEEGPENLRPGLPFAWLYDLGLDNLFSF